VTTAGTTTTAVATAGAGRPADGATRPALMGPRAPGVMILVTGTAVATAVGTAIEPRRRRRPEKAVGTRAAAGVRPR